jgi:putative Ca2+/H+ antiporter (TMEM165/GDT1 family)
MIVEMAIIWTAFTLQLTALPGEKGQFIISSLSTKYNPLGVALGACLAFGLWTVVEIIIGNELKGALPESFLDGAMVVLLIVFGVLLLYDVRSEESSVDVENNEYVALLSKKVPDSLEGAVVAFSVMCLGEFGDKTQLITLGLAAKFGATPEIWIGEMLAIIPVSFANAYAVSSFSEKYSSRKVKYVAVVVIFAFAIDIVAEQAFDVSVLPL